MKFRLLSCLFILALVATNAGAEKTTTSTKIANLLVSDTQFKMAIAVNGPTILDKMKTEMKKHFDISEISDRDWKTLLTIMTEEMSESYLVGMRLEFAKKLGELSSSDQEILLQCVEKAPCKRTKFSNPGIQLMSQLPWIW